MATEAPSTDEEQRYAEQKLERFERALHVLIHDARMMLGAIQELRHRPADAPVKE